MLEARVALLGQHRRRPRLARAQHLGAAAVEVEAERPALVRDVVDPALRAELTRVHRRADLHLHPDRVIATRVPPPIANARSRFTWGQDLPIYAVDIVGLLSPLASQKGTPSTGARI